MGFEQLAFLKDQLAQQALAEKAVSRQKDKTSPASKKTVDPVVQTIGQLQKHFPIAFPKKPAPKVPLKIGIHRDLLERSDRLGISKNALRDAIKTWCWGNRYWECIVEDAVRVDLNGNEDGRVTKENAIQAQKLKAGSQNKKSKVATPMPAEKSPASS